MIDYKKDGVTAMARTTGYTAAVAARLILEGYFDQRGIIPPEYIGRDPELAKFMREGLEARGIEVKKTHADNV